MTLYFCGFSSKKWTAFLAAYFISSLLFLFVLISSSSVNVTEDIIKKSSFSTWLRWERRMFVSKNFKLLMVINHLSYVISLPFLRYEIDVFFPDLLMPFGILSWNNACISNMYDARFLHSQIDTLAFGVLHILVLILVKCFSHLSLLYYLMILPRTQWFWAWAVSATQGTFSSPGR